MALDFISKVLTIYKADTSDHVSSLKKLKGEERERAKQAIEDNEKLKDALDGHLKMLGKVTFAIGTLAGAYASYQAYVERTNSMIAASGIELKKLTIASAGTRSETQLLNDAVAAQGGIFKLNTSAMETVLLAERALGRQGHDLAKVHDALTAAVTKGEVDGLRPFGIAVDKAGASMDDAGGRTKIYNALMAELGKLAGDAGLKHRTAAEEIQAASAKNANSLDSIKNSIGGVVDALRPLTSVASDALGGLAELLDQVTNASLRQRQAAAAAIGAAEYQKRYNSLNQFGKAEMDRVQFLGWLAMQTGYDPRIMAAISTKASAGGALDAFYNQKLNRAGLTDQIGGIVGPAVGYLRGQVGEIGGVIANGGGGDSSRSNAARAATAAAQALARFASAATEADGTSLYGGALGPAGGLGRAAGMSSVFGVDLGKARGDAMQSWWSKELADRQGRRKTFMEQTFGPLDQFSAYKAAFDGFTGAVTAGYAAMVDGTLSFGAAFKRAVADALKATGAQMLIESLKEAAYGTAALFTPGGQAAAVGHFKASAMFAAGAVAAGVAAHELGGSGASGTAGGRGGAGSGAPSGYGSSKPDAGKETIVYVVGDPFDTETDPRRRQANAERVVRNVTRKRGGGQY